MKRKFDIDITKNKTASKLRKIVSFFSTPFTYASAPVPIVETMPMEPPASALEILPVEVFPGTIGQFIPAYSFVGDNTILRVSKRWRAYFSDKSWNDKKNRAAVLTSAYGSYSNPTSDDPLIFLSDHSLYQQFTIYELFRVASHNITLADELFNNLNLPLKLYVILGQTHLEITKLILKGFIPENALNLSVEETSLAIKLNEQENQEYFSRGMFTKLNVNYLLKKSSKYNIEIALYILENPEYKGLLSPDDLFEIFNYHPKLFELHVFKNEVDKEMIIQQRNAAIMFYITTSVEANHNFMTSRSLAFVKALTKKDLTFAQWVLDNEILQQLIPPKDKLYIIRNHVSLLNKYLAPEQVASMQITAAEINLLKEYQAFWQNTLPNDICILNWGRLCHFARESAILTQKLKENDYLLNQGHEIMKLGLAIAIKDFKSIKNLLEEMASYEPKWYREIVLSELNSFCGVNRYFLQSYYAIKLILSNKTLTNALGVDTLEKIGTESSLYFTDHILKHKLIEAKFKTHPKLSKISSVIEEAVGVNIGFQGNNEETAAHWTPPLYATQSYTETIEENAAIILQANHSFRI